MKKKSNFVKQNNFGKINLNLESLVLLFN